VSERGNGAEGSLPQRLKTVLLDARRELIDLSRRNRLLHTARTGKRPHCLEILNANSDELFIGLTRTGKQFAFSAAIDGELVPGESYEPQHGRLRQLQTNLAQEALNRRLLKFFREARTHEEEQGVNILFLFLGMLEWFEDARSEERSSAPLLLIPVSLERRQGRDLFILRGRDDDLILNVSLAEKLRTFGVTLPDFPDGDEWLPSIYFDLVSNAVAGQKHWEVNWTAVGLGFFTFSKFLMWRDLDASVWPDGDALLENELIKNLLGDDSPAEAAPPLVPDDENIDAHIDLASVVHVLDADSSQTLCIEEATRGRNLVVQGPPGTGKSQTIANIIASAAHAGKSVLFVAEKAAALDVVHGRLKSVGLDPQCLELHSRKATKLSVIASLERALRASAAVLPESKTASDLRQARDSLNEWSHALHRQIRSSGRTPYQVLGTVIKLQADQVRVLDQRLDVAADWDRERLAEAERAVDRAALAVHQLREIPIHHAWYGAQGARLTPFDANRLRKTLGESLDHSRALASLAMRASEILACNRDAPCVHLTAFVKALRHLSRVPDEGRGALGHGAWYSEAERIGRLLQCGKLWSSSKADLEDQVANRAWTFDIDSLRQTIAAHGRSLFRWASGRYRRAISELRGLCKLRPPSGFQNRLSLLDSLIDAQIARRKIADESEFGRSILGSLWAGESTPWNTVEILLAWSREAKECDLDLNLLGLAPSADKGSCAAVANRLESAVASFHASITEVVQIVRPDTEAIFGGRVDSAPLSMVTEKIAQWAGAVETLNDWVAARESLAVLDRWEMQQIREGLATGSIDASEARPMADLLIAEALWRGAVTDDPILDQIDGVSRSETVRNFRALDRRRIELARLEVLACYSEKRPSGVSGEMGIVRAEIGKKRRHLPVRQLMERAGSAVQSLKSIFLMSPLSVAQFLPPGRQSFDLIVIDEASQVPPEEAIGAVARARQMIVVGDNKQLPPTNFFRMISEDEDDENASEILTTARARNFESILTLASARGFPERMIRWHYRSRHPSLIAVSNHSCYAGGLLLPPSPITKADNLGLSLVRTPRGHYERGGSGRNLVEADLIAAAVEKHLQNQSDRSLGIACFSVAQRDAIEDALQARGLLSAVDAFAPNGERLFIKNLEAVQGDERDVIFISIGYGPDAQGRMTMGFGPLSADGGERRLNVLISRARLQCTVFSSITAGDIPVDVKPRGTRMLREFLHFAETGHIAAGDVGIADFDSPFEEAVAAYIRRAGYEFAAQVGVSGFRIDLGVLDPRRPGKFALGVECDGAAYHSGRSARDRDRLRQEVLEGLGWKLHRIWSTDWFRKPEREAQKLLTAIELACSTDSPVADTEEKQAESSEKPAIEPIFDGTSTEPQMLPLNMAGQVEPYRECILRVPPAADLLNIGIHELSRLATTVVHHEGPIHFEEIAKRIREAFGLEKTGRRIAVAVDAALRRATREGKVTEDGEFWSPSSEALTIPRCRRDVSASLKRPDRIAPIEYRLAVCAVLRSCVAASKSELTVGTARLLGFDRTGNGLDREISEQIDFLIGSGELIGADSRLELRRIPA
jgi:very-short-patch-repair endonuclease